MARIFPLRSVTETVIPLRWPSRRVAPGELYSPFDRLRNYDRYRNIYYGRFNRAFPTNPNLRNLTDVSNKVNVAAKAINALKAAIWVAPPTATMGEERVRFFAHELLKNQRIAASIGASVLDTILLGDGVLKVTIERNKIRVKSIAPDNYFPELRNPDPQEPQAHNIAWYEDEPAEWWTRERYWFNVETDTWWLTINRFNATSLEETEPSYETNLRVRVSPIIHTHSPNRASGIFFGKAPLTDIEGLVAEYAATMVKIGAITDMATTQALLAVPRGAGDENDPPNLAWQTGRPYYIDDDEMQNFDKSKIGWLDPPGASLVEPNLRVLERLEKDIYEGLGLTKFLFGDTGNIRDTGEPGLRRANLLVEFTTNAYQGEYGLFLNDLVAVASDLARNWLDFGDLPDDYEPLEWKWPDFAPASELERATTLEAKMRLGLPKHAALEEMGYENAQELAEAQASEMAGTFAFPHTPYAEHDPDPEVQARVQEMLS